MPPYAYAQHPAGHPAELEILDAELVAIDGIPVVPDAPWRRLLPESVPEPAIERPRPSRWFDPRDNPELYIYAAAFLIPATAVGLVLWVVVRAVNWFTTEVSTHAHGIATVAGGGVALWVLLALLGGGTAVCAGLHCAGCSRH